MGNAFHEGTRVLLLSFTLTVWKLPAKSLPASRHLPGKSNLYMSRCLVQLSSFSKQQYFPTFWKSQGKLIWIRVLWRGYCPIPYGENVIKEGKIGEATMHVNSSWQPAVSWHLDHRTLPGRKKCKVKRGWNGFKKIRQWYIYDFQHKQQKQMSRGSTRCSFFVPTANFCRNSI